MILTMKEDKYYNEINGIIEKIEVNSRVRKLQDNSEKIKEYWKIEKIIYEAQGGNDRAQYGDKLVKNWSLKLSVLYGNNYSARNLNYYRKFYELFPNVNTLCSQLSWSIIRTLLSIKNENERNYYINQVVLNNLSVRELKEEIKNKAFDRLSYADKENIKLINTNNYNLTIEDMVKDPILIKNDKNINNFSEKVLHKYIIEMLENKFLELGTGFALIGHEYKINLNGKTYRIDLLFFNLDLNAYVVVELKVRELQPKDIGQLEFYVNYVDKNMKKSSYNKTVGLLVVKKNNKFVIEYTTNKDLYITTYSLL